MRIHPVGESSTCEQAYLGFAVISQELDSMNTVSMLCLCSLLICMQELDLWCTEASSWEVFDYLWWVHGVQWCSTCACMQVQSWFPSQGHPLVRHGPPHGRKARGACPGTCVQHPYLRMMPPMRNESLILVFVNIIVYLVPLCLEYFVLSSSSCIV